MNMYSLYNRGNLMPTTITLFISMSFEATKNVVVSYA